MTDRPRFSDDVGSYGFVEDPEGRAKRGRRIVALLRKFHRDDLGPLRVLDVGCSAGLITKEVSRHVAYTVGVDPDPVAIRYAASRLATQGQLAFVCSAGETLPFADGTFDVVLCNHVYEHVLDPYVLTREIARVLRDEGACWFAGGHTMQLIEPHYRLPLLSLLPRSVASWVVRASGRGDVYSIRFLPPWRLRELFKPFRRAIFLTAEVLREPGHYDLVEGPMRLAPVRMAVRAVAPIAAVLSPTQLWLLQGLRRDERPNVRPETAHDT
jgi:2-polyprenyl-3-methyl-5-hydroxy-6-metoxy-1,4-benzoquinol methylase